MCGDIYRLDLSKSPATFNEWATRLKRGCLARRYGLTESVADEYRKILVSHIDQTDESDCAFIQRVANDYGASVKIAGGRLLFIEPLSGKFPDGTPMPAIPIADISSYQMRLTERGKYGKVVAKYYDFDAAEEKQVSAGNESPAFTLRDTFISASQATLRARAKLTEIAAGTKTLSLECVGNSLVGAESVIEVAGIRADICGRWIVKSARHTLSASGYKTNIEATRKD
jgi:phage protein D